MKKDRWMQGYACAIACIINSNGMIDTQVEGAFSAGGLSGLTEPQMQKIGIDGYDIEVFKNHGLLAQLTK